MQIKLHIWILIWIACQSFGLNAQSEFIRHYSYKNAPYLNFCNMLLVSPDTIIISGSTQHVTGNNHQGIYLAKADTLGNILFDTVLAPDHDYFIYEEQYGIIRTSGGGYVIVGQYLDKNNGVLIKTDVNFNIEFVKEFVEDPDVILNIRNEEVIELGEHYYIMSKKQHADDGLEHSHLMKVTRTGGLVWDRTWSGDDWWALFHLEKHRTQDLIMLYGLKSKSHLENPPPDSAFRWLAMIDSAGILAFEHLVQLLPGERIDRFTAYMDDDEIYVTGGYAYHIPKPFTVFSEPYMQRISQDIDVQWEYVHSPKTEGWDYVGFRSIAKCNDGNFVTPLIYITPYGDGGMSPNTLIKFSPEGQKIWERKDSILWNPVQGVFNISNKTVVLPSGSILTAGTTYKFDSTGTDYNLVGYLMKVNNNGCLNGDCPEILTNVDDLEYIAPVDLPIYPNPSEGIYSIHSKSKLEKITVISIDGKFVLENEINAHETTINLSSQQAGIYIITIKGEGFTSSRTVFKL